MQEHAPAAYELYKDVIDWDNIDWDAGFVYTGLFPGDGHKMALAAGAAWQKLAEAPAMNLFFGNWSNPYNMDTTFYGINMDIHGERFMNETSISPLTLNAVKNLQDRKVFCVWDSAYANISDYWFAVGDGTPEGVLSTWDSNVEAGTMVKADTVEELLEQLPGIDADRAAKTIDDWNGYCEQGFDEEFLLGPEMLHPVATPPFYGSVTDASKFLFLTILGGPRTNADLQICDENNDPIEGLYCVGTMVGDFYSTYTFYLSGLNLGSVCGALPYELGKRLASE